LIAAWLSIITFIGTFTLRLISSTKFLTPRTSRTPTAAATNSASAVLRATALCCLTSHPTVIPLTCIRPPDTDFRDCLSAANSASVNTFTATVSSTSPRPMCSFRPTVPAKYRIVRFAIFQSCTVGA
ncbi:hypothetical protein PHMEG_00032768, partial [Phytophthora megakarya]